MVTLQVVREGSRAPRLDFAGPERALLFSEVRPDGVDRRANAPGLHHDARALCQREGASVAFGKKNFRSPA